MMSERAPPFKQSSVTRALRAIEKAGQTARAVRIEPDGGIVIDLGGRDDGKTGNEWDEVLRQ